MIVTLTEEQRSELRRLCADPTTIPADVVAWHREQGVECTEEHARLILQAQRDLAERRRRRQAEQAGGALERQCDELTALARRIAGEQDPDAVGTLFLRWIEVHVARQLAQPQLPVGQLKQLAEMIALRAGLRASATQPATEQRQVVIPQGLVTELFRAAYGVGQ